MPAKPSKPTVKISSSNNGSKTYVSKNVVNVFKIK